MKCMSRFILLTNNLRLGEVTVLQVSRLPLAGAQNSLVSTQLARERPRSLYGMSLKLVFYLLL